MGTFAGSEPGMVLWREAETRGSLEEHKGNSPVHLTDASCQVNHMARHRADPRAYRQVQANQAVGSILVCLKEGFAGKVSMGIAVHCRY